MHSIDSFCMPNAQGLKLKLAVFSTKNQCLSYSQGAVFLRGHFLHPVYWSWTMATRIYIQGCPLRKSRPEFQSSHTTPVWSKDVFSLLGESVTLGIYLPNCWLLYIPTFNGIDFSARTPPPWFRIVFSRKLPKSVCPSSSCCKIFRMSLLFHG